MINFRIALIGLIIPFFLTACGGGGSSSSSGSSGAGAPSSIIGYKMVQTVKKTDGKASTISVGRTVTYQFIDSTTILGEGLTTIPTTSWSYSSSGSSATVRLYYSVGKSVESLEFTSDTSGTYRSESTLNSGTTGWTEGTFVISTISGSGTDTGTGGTPSACETNNTGEISVYTSVGNVGTISVKIDGSTAGSLTNHYTSGSPTCGASSNGGIVTKTVSAGSHSVSATATGTSWPSSTYSIQACGCTKIKLN